MIRDIIIAIDGHSGCGKSTTSRLLAKYLKFKYLDSGAMYRAVTLYFMNKNVTPSQDIKINNALKDIQIDFKYVEGEQHIFLNNNPNIFRKEVLPSQWQMLQNQMYVVLKAPNYF